MSASNISQVMNLLKHDFAVVIDWFKANKLSLNLSKTQYMIFRPSVTDININDIGLSIGNHNVEKVKSTKFLGLFIDAGLNWNAHIQHVCSQLSKGLYILRISKKTIPNWVKKMLYFSFFYSHLVYGLSLWGSMCSRSNSHRIEKLQKNAIRCVENSKYNAHTLPLFKKYRIMKFSDCVEFELCKLGYQVSNKLFP